jgi:hypothetical protein
LAGQSLAVISLSSASLLLHGGFDEYEITAIRQLSAALTNCQVSLPRFRLSHRS